MNINLYKSQHWSFDICISPFILAAGAVYDRSQCGSVQCVILFVPFVSIEAYYMKNESMISDESDEDPVQEALEEWKEDNILSVDKYGFSDCPSCGSKRHLRKCFICGWPHNKNGTLAIS